MQRPLSAFCLAAALATAPALARDLGPLKPYRVLLVVEKWSDPAGQLIEAEKDNFQPVAALLKAWSVPFEIARLDRQRLDARRLLDRSGAPRYGALLWMADLASYDSHDLKAIEEAARAGTSLIVVGSRIADATLEKLLGLKFKEEYSARDPLEIKHEHFITRDLLAQGRRGIPDGDYSPRPWVEAIGATVLASQERHPAVTVRPAGPEASAIWLQPPAAASLRDAAHWRSLFQRSLVWSLGYLVQPDIDYSRRFILEIDDWGSADKGFLSYWRYPTVGEETMRRHVIEPLSRRNAVVAANTIEGFVDRTSRRILSPWKQAFTDLYGVRQDYTSTYRGLKSALEAGVLEIQSHGYTHMQPDLDSPPGPWWDADLAGEGSVIGWYEEFEDKRRGKEIPAAVQLERLRRSMVEIQRDFGVRPLSLRPGGGQWSKSYENHTARLAAQSGFGVFHASTSYFYFLSRDLVLDMRGIGPTAGHAHEATMRPELWPGHPDGPLFLVVHDRDISLQNDFIERILSALPPGMRTLGMNEYVAVLHAGVGSEPSPGWRLTFDFPEPYCRHFGAHASSWRLQLADPLVERLKSVPGVSVSVDGKEAAAPGAGETGDGEWKISIPPGAGRHVWELKARE